MNADAEPQAVAAADLDAARIEQRLVDQLVGHCGGLAAGGEVDRLHERVGPFLLYDLVKPTTAPPSGLVAPASS